jgi:outer membrane protein TolC
MLNSGEKGLQIGIRGGGSLKDPFMPTNHEELAKLKAEAGFAVHRTAPARAIVGDKPLTLVDCRALALTRNPDIRLARLEELARESAKDGQLKRILPHLVLTAELSERDNYRWGYSEVIEKQGITPHISADEAGFGVNRWSAGQERTAFRNSLELNWSPNEAAESYYGAKTGRMERLTAHYRKVRKAQQVIGQVDGAYFRLLGLQETIPLAAKLSSLRRNIQERTKNLYQKQLADLDQLNEAREKAVRTRLLETQMTNKMELQRSLLASAMGISPEYSPDGGFQVVGLLSTFELEKNLAAKPIAELERIGILNRSEGYEAVLRHLGSLTEVKKGMLKYLPRLSGFWRYSRDKDKFVLNKDWREIGVNLRVDLLDILSNNDALKASKYTAAINDQAYELAAVKVLGEIRSAALKHSDARARLTAANESLNNSWESLANARRKEVKGDLKEVAVKEAEADALGKKIDWLDAMGEANATLAELETAMAVNYSETDSDRTSPCR